MLKIKKNLSYLFIFFYLFYPSSLTADTSEIKEILQLIQKDLRTLERAVYSESFSQSSSSNSNNSVKENEDVLTRHLLKLSEIEKQFQQLTNKYEEINFSDYSGIIFTSANAIKFLEINKLDKKMTKSSLINMLSNTIQESKKTITKLSVENLLKIRCGAHLVNSFSRLFSGSIKYSSSAILNSSTIGSSAS